MELLLCLILSLFSRTVSEQKLNVSVAILSKVVHLQIARKDMTDLYLRVSWECSSHRKCTQEVSNGCSSFPCQRLISFLGS